MELEDFDALRARLGDDHVGRRLELQAKHYAMSLDVKRHQSARFYWENFDLMPQVLGILLKLTGLDGRARANTIDYAVRRNTFPIENLPVAFEGYRILHLSDLHIDRVVDGGARLREIISGLEFDICLLTGDYRFSTHGDYTRPIEGMAELVKVLDCPDGISGVIGNHDALEMVPGLEALGLHMMINEARTITRDGQHLNILGTDDVHYYELADLPRALEQCMDGPRVLLVHSPELIPEAEKSGIDLYLAGHTHGGQVCLPGGFAPITNCRCPREFCAGPWRFGRLRGYTSFGTGSSGIPARFNCPPDISVHTLTKA